MRIVYDSLTGRGKKFSSQLGYESIDILDFDDIEDQTGPFILVTRSQDFGKIPEDVIYLMDEFSDEFVGVIAAGNKNWGDNYGAAGDKVEQIYGVPLITKFEGSGFKVDIAIAKKWIEDWNNKNNKEVII